MKKLITVSIFVLTALTSFAQLQSHSSTHLAFKGVPIDGTLREYTLLMEKNGFTYIQHKDGVAILNGDFASYKNCTIGVATLKQKDLVSSITVMFPEKDSWSTLSSNYFSLKELLTEKYGEPSDYTEEFDGIEPRDDNSRMYQVEFDNCKYYATFKTEKGTIQLSIDHEGVSSCFVLLTYHDKINGDIIKQKAIGDL
jgi:hypothetical protein